MKATLTSAQAKALGQRGRTLVAKNREAALALIDQAYYVWEDAPRSPAERHTMMDALRSLRTALEQQS